MKFTEEDDKKKFYLEMPDPDFSPARNQTIIENTIKKHDAKMLQKRKEATEGYQERADAITTYFKVLRQGRRPHLKQFFSKQYLAYLRGDDIRQEIMGRINFINKQDKDKFLRIN